MNNKQQIRCSFFNPIYVLLPLLSFRITDLLSNNIQLAWIISGSTAVILVAYVYFSFRKLLLWYLFSIGLLLIPYLIATFFSAYLSSLSIKLILDDIINFVTFTLLILLQKPYNHVSNRLVKKDIPMSNNLSEINRALVSLACISFFLVFVYSIEHAIFSHSQIAYWYKYLYLVVIGSFIAYETARVKIVRKKLRNEKWWPIVTDQGKIVGNIEHYESLLGEEKYLHPVVRVLVIKNNRIYLRKIKEDNFISPGLWDCAVSTHVLTNENVDDVVKRAFLAHTKQIPDYFFLSNYMYEAKLENRYVFLFVTCNINDFISESTEQTKWWTRPQIEDNLKTGVFTEDFLIEYEIIKRAGFLDAELCQCQCKLKEVIFNQFDENSKR